MSNDTVSRCQETGRLILQDSCYALHCANGARLWLEMDRIPLHLVEQEVRVEGERYGRDLIAVRSIGPLSRS